VVVGANGKRDPTDYDTLAFKLEVKCEKNPVAAEGETDPNKAFNHASGTKQLKFFLELTNCNCSV